MITRDVQEVIAVVDWTDDARVKISLRRARMKMTVTEAKAFRSELDAAIAEADRAAGELVRPIEPARFDLLMGPDCRDEKHHACDGRAWDELADCHARCECTCHTEAVAA